MDQDSEKDVVPKKSEMIIISPQELVQLGLLNKLPWKESPTNNQSTNPTTPSSSVPKTVAENSASSSKPIVLNHVLKMKSPMTSLQIKRTTPNKIPILPRSIVKVTASSVRPPQKILNSDISFKKKTYVVAKKTSVLSKDANLVKNILLSSVQSSKQKRLGSLQEESCSSRRMQSIFTSKSETKILSSATEVKQNLTTIKDVAASTTSENTRVHPKKLSEKECTSSDKTYDTVTADDSVEEIATENSKKQKEIEVNILSNTTVKLSTDEIKKLIYPDGIKSQAQGTNISIIQPGNQPCQKIKADLVQSKRQTINSQKEDNPEITKTFSKAEEIITDKKSNTQPTVTELDQTEKSFKLATKTIFNPDLNSQLNISNLLKNIPYETEVVKINRDDKLQTRVRTFDSKPETRVMDISSSDLSATEVELSISTVAKEVNIVTEEVTDKQHFHNVSTPIKKRARLRKDLLITKSDDQFESIEVEELINNVENNSVPQQIEKDEIENLNLKEKNLHKTTTQDNKIDKHSESPDQLIIVTSKDIVVKKETKEKGKVPKGSSKGVIEETINQDNAIGEVMKPLNETSLSPKENRRGRPRKYPPKVGTPKKSTETMDVEEKSNIKALTTPSSVTDTPTPFKDPSPIKITSPIESHSLVINTVETLEPIKSSIPNESPSPINSSSPSKTSNSIKDSNSIKSPKSIESSSPIESPNVISNLIKNPNPKKSPIESPIKKPKSIENPTLIKNPKSIKKLNPIESPTSVKNPKPINSPVKKPSSMESPVLIERPDPIKSPISIENSNPIKSPIENPVPITNPSPIKNLSPIINSNVIKRKKGRPKKILVGSVNNTKKYDTIEAKSEQSKDSGIETLSNSVESFEDISKISNQEMDVSESILPDTTSVIKEPEKLIINKDIEQPVVQPRKRGRPRKYPIQTDIEKPSTSSIAIMETSLDHFEEKIKDLNSKLEPISDKSSPSSDTSPKILSSRVEPVVTATPQKKRGRKRKAEKVNDDYQMSLTADELESLTQAGVFEEVQIEVSKSGRKRKKINYFDMENNFLDDVIERKSRKQKLSVSSDGESEKVKVRSEKKLKRKLSNEEITDSVDDENVQKVEEKIELSKEVTEKVESKEKTLPEEQEQSINETGKKYKYTGETTKMMRSIFSAAFKDTGSKEASVGENSKSDKSAINRRGRKKFNETESNVVVDEDDKVICTACEKKISNKNWATHNRKVHYNLSWREGENFLNIDDELFLKKTLKPILQEDKKLICYKCEKSFMIVYDFIIHKEECEGVVLGGQVTCAVCNEQMEKTKWSFHKRRKHNNLSWRNGDHPLDLSNQNLVLDILNNLYKAKIPLYCHKCNTSKKSVVGFLSHQSQCGVNEQEAKTQCPHCSKKVLPVSLPSHMKMVHGPKKDHQTIKKLQSSFSDGENNLGKRKAAKNALAMIDSLSKQKPVEEHPRYFCNQSSYSDSVVILKLLEKELLQTNYLLCKFEKCQNKSKCLEEFWNHFNCCEYKSLQYFGCLKCCTVHLTEDKVKEHLKDEHNIILKTDDYQATSEDEEEEEVFKGQERHNRKRRYEKTEISTNKIIIRTKPRFISNLQVQSTKKLFQCAFEYTLEFCNEHFTQSVLFDTLRYLKSNWVLLKDDLLSDYLPKTEESCDVSRLRVKGFENVLKIEHKLKKFELFEVEQQKGGVVNIFCGGPISAMAWLPTPHILLRCNQVLAVAVCNDYDSKYFINANYNEPSVIQFWDCGILKNRIRPVEPELLFCLAVDEGPIWHLEWCPSGCYDENVPSNKNLKQRMGLLAVAGSSPYVCIYPVPFLEEEERGLVYKSQSLVKLQMTACTDNLKEKYYPTKISWGKASRHKYIAVGYTNGMVAIFNLDTKSKTLRFKDADGSEKLLPCKTIKAHTHYISVLSLIHHGGGCRWLLTGSFDSDIHFWDLTNNTKILYSRKKIVADGTWLTNWVSYVTTTDESSARSVSTNAGVASHRNYLYEPIYLGYSPSSLTTVSSSDWLNGILNANGEGDIFAHFPHQLIYSLDNYKRLKNLRFSMGYNRLIDKHKSPEERVVSEKEQQKYLRPVQKTRENQDIDSAAYLFSNSKDFCNEYEPLVYKDIKEKYALVFCDMILNSFDDVNNVKSENPLKDLEHSRPNLYPLKKINKICFNPNCQASLYYSTGYQAGFVRLSYVKFLENDKQVV